MSAELSHDYVLWLQALRLTSSIVVIKRHSLPLHSFSHGSSELLVLIHIKTSHLATPAVHQQ